MKKLSLIFAIFFGVLSVSARNYTHDINVLPEQAHAIIAENFNSEISHIKIGKEFGQIRAYDVVMTDGSKISFDKHGNWKEVEVGGSKAVPAALIPRPIKTFVKDNQNAVKVTGIEKNNYGYDVELSNGMDAKFTEKGKFISYNK